MPMQVQLWNVCVRLFEDFEKETVTSSGSILDSSVFWSSFTQLTLLSNSQWSPSSLVYLRLQEPSFSTGPGLKGGASWQLSEWKSLKYSIFSTLKPSGSGREIIQQSGFMCNMCNMLHTVPVNEVGGHENYPGLRWSHSIQGIKQATECQSSHPLVCHRVWKVKRQVSKRRRKSSTRRKIILLSSQWVKNIEWF